MDRCSGSERRPNLDHHVSNPSPHFDPAAGVFLRRPTVPRRLGRKTLRCPRRWRGGPDRHFSVGRQPSLRAGSPAPPRSRTATVSPGRLSAFCMLSGQSPHSARPRSFVFRSGDRRTANPPPTAGPLPWPAFIRFAVQAPASDCLEYSPNTECHFPASIASGIPIFGTPSTAPGPVPTSCSSHIATNGSSAESTELECHQDGKLRLARHCHRERTLDHPRRPRPCS